MQMLSESLTFLVTDINQLEGTGAARHTQGQIDRIHKRAPTFLTVPPDRFFMYLSLFFKTTLPLHCNFCSLKTGSGGVCLCVCV